MTSRSILVVHNNPNVRTHLVNSLNSLGYDVECLESGDQAVVRLARGSLPSLILLDIVTPGTGAIEAIESLRRVNESIPLIVLSAAGQIKTAFDVMKTGASNFLVKPFEEAELELAIESVIQTQKLKDEVKTLREQLDAHNSGHILSSNPKMLEVQAMADTAAETGTPVLIGGESGVGKKVLARDIHSRSSRRGRPFVKVNCAALPNELLEFELFGYGRGAFSRASYDRPGKFELADGGTLLLEEIGEMAPQLQAKLLQVLQHSEYIRLGEKRSVHVDARLIAATNTSLEESVANGKFRDDLYLRLNSIRVNVPPLRERREDIPVFCSHFVSRYRDRYKSAVEEVSTVLVNSFLRYDWPGNVRQLENAIKRYLILPEMNPSLSEFREQAASNVVPISVKMSDAQLSLKDVGARAAQQAEQDLVLRILEETSWNRKQAARRMNICYKALLNKLKRWQMDNRPTAQTLTRPATG
jgi:two-component system, NtrC family, response regulator AtoC